MPKITAVGIAARKAEDLLREKQALARERVLRGPPSPFYRMLFTEDPHGKDGNPVQPFPVEKPYVQELLRALDANRRLAVPKSRQVLATWTCLVWLLRRAMARPSWYTAMMSMRKEESYGLIRRMRFLIEHMPTWMFDREPKHTKSIIELPNGSIIEAFPCIDRVGTSHTIGDFFGDEVREWPDVDEVLRGSVIPALGAESHCVLISTAEEGPWDRFCNANRVLTTYRSKSFVLSNDEWQEWDAENGFHVVRLHYSCDPAKNPSTPEGAEWYQEALVAYGGDPSNGKWQREMEINFSAAGGTEIFSGLYASRDEILVGPTDFPEHAFDFYAGFDFGPI